MSKRFFSTVLGVVMSLMIATAAFAEFVYVTKNGKKYHTEDSRFLKGKKEIEKLSIEEAEELGYEPSREYLKQKAATKKTKRKKKK